MKTLTVDVETSPMLVKAHQLRTNYINHKQIVKDKALMSFAAKWQDKKSFIYRDVDHHGLVEMCEHVACLLDEADLVVHYYGDNFDVPMIRSQLQVMGIDQPSSFRTVDLYKVVKKNFHLASYSLAYVCKYFGLKHQKGERLTDLPMTDKEWASNRKYNIGDVKATEELFALMLPFTPPQPQNALRNKDVMTCGRCGSIDLERRGYKVLNQSIYQQYQCRACKGWLRDTKATERIHTVGVT